MIEQFTNERSQITNTQSKKPRGFTFPGKQSLREFTNSGPLPQQLLMTILQETGTLSPK